MKSKITLSLIIIILFFCSTKAVKAQIEFGIKAGINTSTHSFEVKGIGSNTKYINGFQGGFWINNSIKDKFELLSEINASREGFKLDYYDLTTFTYYVNINTALTYRISSQLKIGVGPQMGYLLYANWDNIDKYNVTSQYSKIAVGLNLSINYEFEIPLTIGFRYHQGLNDISKQEVNLTDENGNPLGKEDYVQINRNFQINIYYRLNSRKK